MPFDPESPFGATDPSAWLQAGALPRIFVHPKPPPNTPGADGINDWYVPGQASDGPDDWFVPAGAPADTSDPDDWFVPTPSANVGQLATGAQTATNQAGSNRFAAPPDPFAAYWSRIPASRVGAMAWDPPVFPGSSRNNPSTWLPGQSPPVGTPSIPKGGMLDVLGDLGSWSPAGTWIPAGGILGALANVGLSAGSESSIPSGGLLGALAQVGSTEPDLGAVLPPPPQPPSPYAQALSPQGRRPLADVPASGIVGDAAKSLGVRLGQLGVQTAGLPGDAREMIAGAAQRAADYFVPGSAPNVGSKVSHFLASRPLFAGPTSSQLQKTVELYTGPFYQPKTIVGDYARTAGEIVPGALLMPEGSLAAKAIRYGLLPALSSETAGQLTKGTPAEPWARIVGAVLGAGPAAWRDLLGVRNTPRVVELLGESELSPAEQLAARQRKQLEVNKAAGAAFEESTEAELRQQGDLEFARQITVQLPSGARVRLDFVTRNRVTGEIRCIECKSSATAPVTSDQAVAFSEMEQQKAIIVGKGKPGFPGGMEILQTRVEIKRPRN